MHSVELVWFCWYIVQRCPAGNLCELLSKIYVRMRPSCKTSGILARGLVLPPCSPSPKLGSINLGHDYG